MCGWPTNATSMSPRRVRCWYGVGLGWVREEQTIAVEALPETSHVGVARMLAMVRNEGR